MSLEPRRNPDSQSQPQKVKRLKSSRPSHFPFKLSSIIQMWSLLACFHVCLFVELVSNVNVNVDSSSKLQEKNQSKISPSKPSSLNQVHALSGKASPGVSLSVMLKVLHKIEDIIPCSFSAQWSVRPRPDIMNLKGRRKREKEASLNTRTMPVNAFWWIWFVSPPVMQEGPRVTPVAWVVRECFDTSVWCWEGRNHAGPVVKNERK